MTPLHFSVLTALCAAVHGFPHNGILKDFEASGGDVDEPSRGMVKVFKISPHFLQQPGSPQRAPGLRSGTAPRSPFPAFLALGRPGPGEPRQGAALVAPHKRLEANVGPEVLSRHGLDMWRRAMEKSSQGKEALPLPGNVKDASRQSCSTVPFVQRVTEVGCDAVAVPNKLCFGQCSSLFVPPGAGARGTPCARCAPSKARYATVTLRCRATAQAREKHVMLVEECRCEAGREAGREEERAREPQLHFFKD
ncbi:DAN domain family member 5 [Scleropages formosus]|uniref:DAN domain family member 5 n=1 Tax=Scleropages formosus TaxID=113540 RepID=UPI0010FA7B95|nr:DAN domain family member 5 [Scleropages formosus]